MIKKINSKLKFQLKLEHFLPERKLEHDNRIE